MSMWNPWRGCHRHSEGCRYCYIHKGDKRKGIDTGQVVRTEQFYAPVEKTKSGIYKMKPGQTVYLCFSSDFLVEDAGKAGSAISLPDKADRAVCRLYVR